MNYQCTTEQAYKRNLAVFIQINDRLPDPIEVEALYRNAQEDVRRADEKR